MLRFMSNVFGPSKISRPSVMITPPILNNHQTSKKKCCPNPNIPDSECVPLKCRRWSSNGFSVMHNEGTKPDVCYHGSFKDLI